MIKEFVEKWEQNKGKIREAVSAKHPDDYQELVKIVVENLQLDSEYESMDPERIHKIDDGDYQGTLLFVIGAKGYQPSDYWSVQIYYGSCSGCDTLQRIREYKDEDGPPSPDQVDQYMTLALHIVQKLKKISDGYEDIV